MKPRKMSGNDFIMRSEGMIFLEMGRSATNGAIIHMSPRILMKVCFLKEIGTTQVTTYRGTS
jgi:hypothetical protein